MQCNFLTDILNLVYLRFAENVQRVHLCTEVPAASWMLELFGESGGDVPEYFSSGKDVRKLTRYKAVAKNSSKNYSWCLVNLSLECAGRFSSNQPCSITE